MKGRIVGLIALVLAVVLGLIAYRASRNVGAWALPQVKTVDRLPQVRGRLDLPSCALMGTVVHAGAGHGVVVATGLGTAFGQVGRNHIRISYANSQPKIREALDRVRTVIAPLTV